MSNQIYFPVYERIEKETLELSSAIYFNDDHAKVYSIYIADLIFRCSVELESIAKDIYRKETKTEPQNPGVCFAWMEEHWKISKKSLFIDSPYFHFEEKLMPFFCPFEYKKDSEDDYYSRYNAIKHERVKNLSMANVYTLIRVLGALYVLNLYYSDENLYLGEDRYGSKIDKKKYSKIFSFNIAPCMDAMLLDSQKDVDPESCIYKIIRKESQYAFRFRYRDSFDEMQSTTMVQVNNDFQKYAKSCLGRAISIDDLIGCLSKIQGISPEIMRNAILSSERQIKEMISIEAIKMKSSYWVKLNK